MPQHHRPSPSAQSLVARAKLKLGPDSPRWRNLLSFLRACYLGRPGRHDADGAAAALAQLSDAEQNALVAWVFLSEERHEEAA